MNKGFVLALCTVALFLGLSSTAAHAQQCTASVNCHNSCFLNYECPRPYPPCTLVCSASSQVVSCTGVSSCTTTTTSVTCDGVTKSCPTTSQCHQSLYSISCGSTTRQCTYNCPV
ncbi:MAG TPA: hypothetical protein VLB76_08160 [Thermoanaerobaculia bacterium]|jgi:hypothetical protein|nr:hypothetical protein [Thermoanaerobaculia bacterium]